MLKDYLAVAQDALRAQKELYQVKEQRLALALDQYVRLNDAYKEKSSSRTSLFSGSSSSTKYDPDILKAEISTTKVRVSSRPAPPVPSAPCPCERPPFTCAAVTCVSLAFPGGQPEAGALADEAGPLLQGTGLRNPAAVRIAPVPRSHAQAPEKSVSAVRACYGRRQAVASLYLRCSAWGQGGAWGCGR
uniref:Uncharacterized protein n=1 Tax=Paramormyrops kingsleyae TaxID=1676925 RepID=A0A3B3R5G5_9TELE